MDNSSHVLSIISGIWIYWT